jgi:hypothetical protein|tara:strand:+ start:7304 stop:7555 length:252 start_codon:yes stop_codon:yes gene_type:complete
LTETLAEKQQRLFHGKWEGNLPNEIPKAFFEDVVEFQRMFDKGTVACTVHGEEHQREMIQKWPEEWILWMFDKIGAFTPDEEW